MLHREITFPRYYKYSILKVGSNNKQIWSINVINFRQKQPKFCFVAPLQLTKCNLFPVGGGPRVNWAWLSTHWARQRMWTGACEYTSEEYCAPPCVYSAQYRNNPWSSGHWHPNLNLASPPTPESLKSPHHVCHLFPPPGSSWGNIFTLFSHSRALKFFLNHSKPVSLDLPSSMVASTALLQLLPPHNWLSPGALPGDSCPCEVSSLLKFTLPVAAEVFQNSYSKDSS